MTGPSITVDRDQCIGSGMCVAYAPGTFEHDEQATVVVRHPPGDPVAVIATAVEACPTGALRLGPDGTGQ